MYKEDIDLAYKMRWLGLEIAFLPCVLGYHARTLSKKTKKSSFLAEMSYKNHLIMLRNNIDRKFSFKTKLLIFLYESSKFFYYLLRKPKIAMQLFKIFKFKNLKYAKKKISPKKMESYLLN
jgi:GT2 family glycosyltransferase